MPVIHPKIDPTPDFPVIQFRDPREQVELDKQLPLILEAQGWLCGTYFHVQFVNHESTELLLDALFVVTKSVNSLRTAGSVHAPNTKEVTLYKAEQIGGWRSFNGYEIPEDEEGTQGEGRATIRWNPGKKAHEVIVDGEVVYENSDKPKAEKARDDLNKVGIAA